MRDGSAVVLDVELEDSCDLWECGSLSLNLPSGSVSAASAKIGVHVLSNGFSNGLDLATNVDQTISLSKIGFWLFSSV